MKLPFSFFSTIVRLFLFVSFVISAFNGHSQDLELVKAEHPGNKWVIEEYSVLKENPSVKHGQYKRIYFEKVEVTGQYDNNIKTGVWEFYDRKGELMQRYDYSNKQLLFNEGFIHTTSEADTTIEQAVLIGGVSEFYGIIGKNLRYPASANRKGVQGRVYISFEITEKGEMVNEKILKGIGEGCEEEALRVVKLIPDEWIPAKLNGEPVVTSMVVPINFRLDNRKKSKK